MQRPKRELGHADPRQVWRLVAIESVLVSRCPNRIPSWTGSSWELYDTPEYSYPMILMITEAGGG